MAQIISRKTKQLIDFIKKKLLLIYNRWSNKNLLKSSTLTLSHIKLQLSLLHKSINKIQINQAAHLLGENTTTMTLAKIGKKYKIK